MRWTMVSILLATALVACRPNRQQADGTGVVVTVQTDTVPVLGTTPLTVLLERDGEPVAGAEVRVTGDMTHAGMIPVLRDTVEVEPGVYRAADFEFTMAGDWIITADVTLPDGERTIGELTTDVDGN